MVSAELVLDQALEVFDRRDLKTRMMLQLRGIVMSLHVAQQFPADLVVAPPVATNIGGQTQLVYPDNFRCFSAILGLNDAQVIYAGEDFVPARVYAPQNHYGIRETLSYQLVGRSVVVTVMLPKVTSLALQYYKYPTYTAEHMTDSWLVESRPDILQLMVLAHLARLAGRKEDFNLYYSEALNSLAMLAGD